MPYTINDKTFTDFLSYVLKFISLIQKHVYHNFFNKSISKSPIRSMVNLTRSIKIM